MSRCCRAFLVALLCALLSLGCATEYGARTVPPTRFNYNEAITRSLNEQLLLNLVRLRYRDTPFFLDVGSVIAHYTWGATASVNPEVSDEEGFGSAIGVGGEYAENPTITYEPLKGAAFTRRLLTPIDPLTLVLLAESGWSIERLLVCCVQRLNGLANAPSATGPAPFEVPDNSRFRRAARLLRELQVNGLLQIQPFLEEERQGVRFALADLQEEAAGRTTVDELRELLGLAADENQFFLRPQTIQQLPNEIAVWARSLLGVFFFLSLAVEPPVEHRTYGLVPGGAAPLDWHEVIMNLLRIRSQREAPVGAFAQVRYRGYWFSIDDDDLESKATFNLLIYLYSLQAAGPSESPLLTLPVR